MDAGMTSIDDLPMNQVITDATPVQQYVAPPAPTQPAPSVSFSNPTGLSPEALQHLANVLSKQQGALPSRDIPRETGYISNDQQVKPNYMPRADNLANLTDAHDIYNELLEKQRAKVSQQNTMDYVLDELQFPLIVAVIYFIFQLPYVTRAFYNVFPSMHMTDGNPALSMFVFKSCVVGAIIYVIQKLMRNI